MSSFFNVENGMLLIIHSRSLDCYYIGSTHFRFDERLRSHKEGKYQSSYKSLAPDRAEYVTLLADSPWGAIGKEKYV